jgi:hypothetical protein
MVRKILNWYLNLVGVEGEGGDAGKGAKGGEGGEKVFTQPELERLLGERLARERSKYQDYDDLKKFKEEHAKEQDKLKQDELVRQKKYEEAEGTYKKQIGERDQLVAEKDRRITDMTITQAIANEATKMNGFLDETIALVRGMATVTKDGQVVMKVKDTNGIEKDVSVEEGLKTFYASRPHLVKANGQGGSGTPPAGGAGGGSGSGLDLGTLNNQYYQAMQAGNRKLAAELKAKITPLMKGNRNTI